MRQTDGHTETTREDDDEDGKQDGVNRARKLNKLIMSSLLLKRI